jgi:hypothetical protein
VARAHFAAVLATIGRSAQAIGFDQTAAEFAQAELLPIPFTASRMVVLMGEIAGFEMVPLQGAYLAMTCPVAPQLAADTTLSTTAVPFTAAEQLRVDDGVDFEHSIFQTILRHHSATAVVIQSGPRADVQVETAAALASDATLILGGWLPDDQAARRTGRPDVLLRAETGWVPIDVKHHAVTTPSLKGSELRSELHDPWPHRALLVSGVEVTTNGFRDVLQLSHYRRLLEAAGLASDEPIAGIIGVDERIVWVNLSALCVNLQ